MPNDDREFSKRSEINKGKRSGKEKKLDRLLNILIAIVALLIVVNGYFLFTKNNDVNEPTNEQLANRDSKNNTKESKGGHTKSENDQVDENDQVEESVSSHDNPSQIDSNNETQTEEHTTIKLSNEAIVDEVIVNENWQPTPTKQTGEHQSTYQEGHIDYEEKLETIRNAVNLSEENIIFWSVRNNGSNNSSIAVVSSKDHSEKYRVSIEWIENRGWKPFKVEKLKRLEGAYLSKE